MTATPEHLTAAQYNVTCKCLRCDHVYTKRVSAALYQRIVTNRAPDPPCPRKACKAALLEADVQRRATNMANILASQRAPGHVGSITAKSIDFTNELVATDYGLTDLKDRVKVGESSAPRLSPVLQEQADNFFGGGSLRQNPMLAARISSIGAAAAAGAFAPKPNAPVSQGGHIIDQVMGAKKIAPYKVIASDRR